MIIGDIEKFEQYHIYAEHGLINDPNGLIYFNGQYHVFYQWNPNALDHTYKVWAHVVSDDLVNWRRLPIAIAPSLPEDRSGIYSGTTIEKDGRLYAFYTGNVRNDAGESVASFQMAAVSDDGVQFEKLGKLFEQPSGYTRHVRDPKVFERNGHYYMLLGAQKLDLTGDIIAYESTDLHHWSFMGSILGDQLSAYRGYMMECPDLVTIDGRDVLMFSPQGLTAAGDHLQNIHNTGYVLGEFDDVNGVFQVTTEFKELDQGFEFYASQTLTHGNRHLLWGWAGMMPSVREKQLPTIQAGWAHVLSLPRDMAIVDGELRQYPIPELGDFQLVHPEAVTGLGLWRLAGDKWQVALTSKLSIQRDGDIVTFTRVAWESGETEERRTKVTGDVLLVIDNDVVELYTTSGDTVMTARYFD
ncbi:glycoside hydrolase family 32 protein [Weissella confusa]|uniref:glycoside hydrolase family 32 protein n=1 Tax=Weissella confusa TaxID=1583 RepID=UPI0018F25CC5|nr:glycoside hydrolase family 32 protein [Weissella confusa]MBJ7686988.1 glycoside hydrolase family 32 protein [Weissella confusa]MBJ7697453.1 glycoside hydrolase family 32 protein [Weissella confusa]